METLKWLACGMLIGAVTVGLLWVTIHFDVTNTFAVRLVGLDTESKFVV